MTYSVVVAAGVLLLAGAVGLNAQDAAPSVPKVKMPLIIAHRGVPTETPENTMGAFRRSLEQDADAIETDLRLTGDGKIILIHDPGTKRTCGTPNRVVAETSFDELRKLDAGKWKGEQFAGEKLPTLTELLEIVPPEKMVFLEIKCGPEIVPQFVRELRASKLKPEQIRVITFNDAVIPAFKAAMPEVQAFLLYEFKRDEAGKWSDTAENLVRRAKALGADGLDLSVKPKTMEPVTPALVAAAKAQGMSFHAWTIDDAAIARHAIALGAESLTTNRAGGLRRELQEGSGTTQPAGPQ